MQNKKLLSVLVSLVLLCACVLGVLVMGANAETEYDTWTVDGTSDAANHKYATVADALAAAAEADWASNKGLQINIETATAQPVNADGAATTSFDILFGVQTIFRADNTKLPITIQGSVAGVELTHDTDYMVATNDYTFKNLKFDMGSNAAYFFFAGSGEVVFDTVDLCGAEVGNGFIHGDNPAAEAYNGWTQAHFDANKDTDGLLPTSVTLKNLTYLSKTYTLQAGGADSNEAYARDGSNGSTGVFDGEGFTYTNGGLTIQAKNTKAKMVLDTCTVSEVEINADWFYESPLAKRDLIIKNSTVNTLYGIGLHTRTYSQDPNRGFPPCDYYVELDGATINTKMDLITGAIIRGDVTLTIKGDTQLLPAYTCLVQSANVDGDITVNIEGGNFPGTLAMSRNTGKVSCSGAATLNISGGTFGYDENGAGLDSGIVRGFNVSGYGYIAEEQKDATQYINATTGKAENLPYTDEINITGGKIYQITSTWYNGYFYRTNISGGEIANYYGSTIQQSAGGNLRYVETNVTDGTIENFVGGGDRTTTGGVNYIVNTVSGGTITNFHGSGLERTYTKVVNNIETGANITNFYGGNPDDTGRSTATTTVELINNFNGGAITGVMYGTGISPAKKAATTSVTNNVNGTVFPESSSNSFNGTYTIGNVVVNVTNNVPQSAFSTFKVFYATRAAVTGTITNNIGDEDYTGAEKRFGGYFYGGTSWAANVVNNWYHLAAGQVWLTPNGGTVSGNVTNNLTDVRFTSFVYLTYTKINGDVTNNLTDVEMDSGKTADDPRHLYMTHNRNTASNTIGGKVTNNVTRLITDAAGQYIGTQAEVLGGVENNMVDCQFGASFYGTNATVAGGVKNTFSGSNTVAGTQLTHYLTNGIVTGNVTNEVTCNMNAHTVWCTYGGAVTGDVTNSFIGTESAKIRVPRIRGTGSEITGNVTNTVQYISSFNGEVQLTASNVSGTVTNTVEYAPFGANLVCAQGVVGGKLTNTITECTFNHATAFRGILAYLAPVSGDSANEVETTITGCEFTGFAGFRGNSGPVVNNLTNTITGCTFDGADTALYCTYNTVGGDVTNTVSGTTVGGNFTGAANTAVNVTNNLSSTNITGEFRGCGSSGISGALVNKVTGGTISSNFVGSNGSAASVTNELNGVKVEGNFYGNYDEIAGAVTNIIYGDSVIVGSYNGIKKTAGSVNNYFFNGTYSVEDSGAFISGTGATVTGAVTNYYGARPDPENAGQLLFAADGNGPVFNDNFYGTTGSSASVTNHWYEATIADSAYGNDGFSPSIKNYFYGTFNNETGAWINGAGGNTSGADPLTDTSEGAQHSVVENFFYEGAKIAGHFYGADGKPASSSLNGVAFSKVINTIEGGNIATFNGGVRRGHTYEIENIVSGGTFGTFYGGVLSGGKPGAGGNYATAEDAVAETVDCSITNTITGGEFGEYFGGNGANNVGATADTIVNNINGGIYTGAFNPASVSNDEGDTATTKLGGKIQIAPATRIVFDDVTATSTIVMDGLWEGGVTYVTVPLADKALVTLDNSGAMTAGFGIKVDEEGVCKIQGYAMKELLANLKLTDRIVVKIWVNKADVDLYMQETGKAFQINGALLGEVEDEVARLFELGAFTIETARDADGIYNEDYYYVFTMDAVGAGYAANEILITGSAGLATTGFSILSHAQLGVTAEPEMADLYKAIYNYGAYATGNTSEYALSTETPASANSVANRGNTDSIRFTAIAPLMGDAVGIRLIGTPDASYDATAATLKMTVGGNTRTLVAGTHYKVNVVDGEARFDIYFNASNFTDEFTVEVITGDATAMTLTTSVERAVAQLVRLQPDNTAARALWDYVTVAGSYAEADNA